MWVWDDVGLEGEKESVDDADWVRLDVAVGGSERVAEVFSVKVKGAVVVGVDEAVVLCVNEDVWSRDAVVV